MGNYTTNSTYNTNLNILLSNITTSIQIDHVVFYKFSVGHGSDQVYGIGLCRVFLSVSDCESCLGDASARLRVTCPNQKQAIGYYTEFLGCMLRYSDHPDGSISEIIEDYPGCVKTLRDLGPQHYYPIRGPDGEKSNQTIFSLLRNLSEQTARSGPKYAFGSASVNASLQIYGLTVCNPDLSSSDCLFCLKFQIIRLPITFTEAKGASIYGPSCSVEFRTNNFFNNLPVPQPHSTAPPISPTTPEKKASVLTSSKKKASVVTTLVVPLVAATILVFLLSGCYWFCILNRKTQKVSKSNDLSEISVPESLHFDFNTIKIATNEFSVDNKLGQGGFGPVYKGNLQNGLEIAVKRLSNNSGQGIEEFKNEALLLVKLQHKNLVRLLGFCVEQKEMLLVYELVPNLSLEKFLFDPDKRALLDWPARYKIITGIARGLMYLHEDSRLTVIHRDLKCSNVLLDNAMNPRISDFGTARLFGADQITANTNRIVGTYGYMAPEYAMDGQFSTKSDVYSFGVIILEIVSGQSNSYINSSENQLRLVLRAWTLWNETKALSLVDMALGDIQFDEEVTKCIHIGLLCLQDDATKRPTMHKIEHALNDDYSSNNLPKPTPPQFLMTHDIVPYTGISTHESGILAAAEITDPYPR